MKKGKVDKDWFHAKAKAKGLSLRAVAAKMTNSEGNPLDQGRLSEILSGRAEMFVRELDQLVEILDLDPCEAFARARGKRR